ncbi:hypothetical protein JTB14_021915 [Gonioctena quinquepunctata]|nr:hypothetical protein JTB14_021915 [Gonioctena quinquepunctata]
MDNSSDDLETFSDLENIEREDIGELMDISDKENIEASEGVDNNDMTDNATEKTELTNYEVNDFILVELKIADMLRNEQKIWLIHVLFRKLKPPIFFQWYRTPLWYCRMKS